MKLSSICIVASTLSGFTAQETSAAHLRANGAAHKSREAAYQDVDFFECDVVEIMGVAFPGEEDELAPRLSCETDIELEFRDEIFSLEGATEDFFHGLDLSYGDVRIRVPVDVVGKHNVIHFDDVTSKQVIISYTGIERRNLSSSSPTGKKYVLVIRVSDDGDKCDSSSSCSKVAQSASQLSTEIFSWRNMNLKTIYKRCSDGNLLIKEARGPGIEDGVLHLDAPDYICSMTYDEVSSWVFTQNKVKSLFSEESTAKVTHKMIVMPNSPCVDFKGAAAWGQVNRSISWYQSRSVSFPAVHVHEFGHNLGMKHSGAPDDQGVYRAYADGNGYMGNRAIWDKEGSAMCFNAAKMWYFGWWSSFHETLKPTSTAQYVKLIPLYDLAEDTFVSTGSNIMIVKLESSDSKLYINFNVAKGLNAGVRADPNKVVITEQNGKTVVSTWKASLGQAGQTYRQSNWNDNGEDLIIEVLSISLGSNGNTANVKIILEDGGGGAGVSNICKNYIPRGDYSKWYDADGEDYDCDWYANMPPTNKASNCAKYGDMYDNFEKNANQACCACGKIA